MTTPEPSEQPKGTSVGDEQQERDGATSADADPLPAPVPLVDPTVSLVALDWVSQPVSDERSGEGEDLGALGRWLFRSTGSGVSRSSDALSWEPVAEFPGSGPSTQSVSAGRLLVAGTPPSPAESVPYLAVTTDGESWVEYLLPVPQTATGAGADRLFASVSAVGGDVYVAGTVGLDVTTSSVFYPDNDAPGGISREDGVIAEIERSGDTATLRFIQQSSAAVLDEIGLVVPPAFPSWALENLADTGRADLIWHIAEDGAISIEPQPLSPYEEIRRIFTVDSSVVALVDGPDGQRLLTLSGDPDLAHLPQTGPVDFVWEAGDILIAGLMTGVADHETWAFTDGEWSKVPGVEFAVPAYGSLGWMVFEPSGPNAVYSADGNSWVGVDSLIPGFGEFKAIYTVALTPSSAVIWGGNGGERPEDTWLLIGSSD